MFAQFQEKIVNAILNGNLEDVRTLVLGPNDINKPLCPTKPLYPKPISDNTKIPSIYGPTPLVFAILCGKISIVKYLVEDKKADITLAVNGLEPIHYAALVGIPEILKILINMSDFPESFVNRQNIFRYTPLYLAVGNENLQAVIVLLDNNAHVNIDQSQLPQNFNTPLHASMRNHDTKIIELLLARGANINARNKINELPIDTAKFFKNSLIVEYLEKYSRGIIQIPPYEYLSSKYSNDPKNIVPSIEVLSNIH